MGIPPASRDSPSAPPLPFFHRMVTFPSFLFPPTLFLTLVTTTSTSFPLPPLSPCFFPSPQAHRNTFSTPPFLGLFRPECNESPSLSSDWLFQPLRNFLPIILYRHPPPRPPLVFFLPNKGGRSLSYQFSLLPILCMTQNSTLTIFHLFACSIERIFK